MNIAELELQPHQVQKGFIETPEYHGLVKQRVPVIAATGSLEGPTVAVIAAQHGRELNGIEVIRRVLEKIDIQKLRGTLVALPVANPLAVSGLRQDFPHEFGRYLGNAKSASRFNMNRQWTGVEEKSWLSEHCSVIFNEIVSKSDCTIDLHTWGDVSHGLAWTTEEHVEILKAFGMPLSLVKSADKLPQGGQLETACYKKGIPNLTAELPRQNRLREDQVQTGTAGIINVLRYFEMLPGDPEHEQPGNYITQDSPEHLFLAKTQGLWSPEKQIGDHVKTGECIGRIISLENLEPLESFKAPYDGIVFHSGVQFAENRHSTDLVYPDQHVSSLKAIAGCFD